MSIPGFQAFLLPLLKLVKDGEEHRITDAYEQLADEFSLTAEERAELIPSGTQPLFHNRVSWARTYLKKAGLVIYPKRAFIQITDRGLDVLSQDPELIDKKYLRQFPEYVEFIKRSKGPAAQEETNGEDLESLTPEEVLENAYQNLRKELVDDLLDYVLNSTPGFFEKLVVELLVKMGYGGTQREAARAVGRSGDEGIDGVIDEDRLGLETIYIQAKRWKKDQTIGRPEIQKFVGALVGKAARKGVFITTASFSPDAKRYVELLEKKVVLIDGERLANLMIDYGVGVSTRAKYEVKELDTDYFGEGAGKE